MSAGVEQEGGTSMGGEPLTEQERLERDVAYIESALVPQKAIYTRQDHPRLEVTCFNHYGDEVPTPELYILPRPDNSALLSDDNELSFIEEGQGALKICVEADRDTCGRVSFYVDDAPPKLSLTSPEPFAVISGEDSILVEGRAEGHTALLVNDELVDTDDEGRFSLRVPATFGYNTIQVVADDGVQRPLTAVLRAPLFAPQLLPLAAEGQLATPLTLSALFPEGLFDGEAPPPPMPGEPFRFYDFSRPIEHMISQLNLGALINPVLQNSPNFNLSVGLITVSRPEVSFMFVEGGAELFVRFGELSMETFGDFLLEGLNVSLNGSVSIDLSSFVSLSIRPDPSGSGAVIMEVDDIGVALEDMNGDMVDPTAQALIDTLTSALRVTIGQAADSLARSLLSARLPQALERSLSVTLGLFNEVPLTFDVPGTNAQVSADLSFGLNALTPSALGHLLADFQINLSAPSDAELSASAPDTSAVMGVPAHLDTPTPWPAAPGADAHIAIPLSMFNTLLYQIWRQGALNLNLAAQIPPALREFSGINQLKVEAMRPPLLMNAPAGSPAPLRLSLEALVLSIGREGFPNVDRYALSVKVPVSIQVIPSAVQGEPSALSIDFPEEPELRTSFVEQGNALPVLPLASAIYNINTQVWDALEGLLRGGFSIPVPRSTVNLGDAVDFGRDVEVSIEPVVSELLRVTDGWLMFSGGLLFEFAP